MSTINEKQFKFTRLIAKLIEWAYANGYELSVGDAYRDPRLFGEVGEQKGYGRARSNHKIRLAMDFNLFIDGEYQTTSEAHRPLGEYWESLDPECSWGGRFHDGNHYSLIYQNRR